MKFEDLIKKMVLLEMPLAIDKIDFSLDQNKIKDDKYKMYILLGTFDIKDKKFSVYIHKQSMKHQTKWYNINLGNKTLATYAGKEVKDGIRTDTVESVGKDYNIKSLMCNFYIGFLFKKYSFVISDDALTGDGFKFWYNNFDRFIQLGYKMSVVYYEYKNEIIEVVKQLSNKDEMHEYYGKILANPSAGKHRYMVSK